MRHNQRSHNWEGHETPENHPLTILKGFYDSLTNNQHLDTVLYDEDK